MSDGVDLLSCDLGVARDTAPGRAVRKRCRAVPICGGDGIMPRRARGKRILQYMGGSLLPDDH
jgi:hypothetical protein